jgi:hypothetical protein
MSKSIAIRALLGTLVFCVPGLAVTTIPDEEVRIWLRGLEQTAPDTYELAVGTLALLEVRADRGDIVAVYAGDSQDLSRFFLLVAPTSVDAYGIYLQFFTVPAEAAGMTFRVQAIASDGMRRHLSNPLTISVTNSQILHAPPPARARLGSADPVIVN